MSSPVPISPINYTLHEDFIAVDVSTLEEGQECSICLGEFLGNDAVAHKGGVQHPFHRACIDQYIDFVARIEDTKCPNCKTYTFTHYTNGDPKIGQAVQTAFVINPNTGWPEEMTWAEIEDVLREDYSDDDLDFNAFSIEDQEGDN